MRQTSGTLTPERPGWPTREESRRGTSPGDRMHAFHPAQSLNHVTSHDGFTLHDLVSYEAKRNWANGHANTDGPADDGSWNCGWEGEENVPSAVVALRKRQAKNFCCLLLLAKRTPMIRAGDEFIQQVQPDDRAQHRSKHDPADEAPSHHGLRW